jgi:hypothetical protein
VVVDRRIGPSGHPASSGALALSTESSLERHPDALGAKAGTVRRLVMVDRLAIVIAGLVLSIPIVPLANTEAVEMMRLAQLWQTGPVDIGMALGCGGGALVITESRTALQLENIALRHQIGVLQRSAKKRLRLHNSERLFWVGLSRVWSEWRSALVIVKPDTVIAWHRRAFRLLWSWKVRRGKPGRPAVTPEIRALIRRMSDENPGWGAPRIHGELLKLGIDIGETSVSKYLVRRRKPPSQTPRNSKRAFSSPDWDGAKRLCSENRPSVLS